MRPSPPPDPEYVPDDGPVAEPPRRPPPSGRGAGHNPPNRFDLIGIEPDPEEAGEERAPATRYYRDRSRSVISTNDSPDVGIEASLNPYRGCQHGCVYCYARPTHEYLGLSAGLDFETKIWVKEDAPQLLERELRSPRWTPKVLVLSGVTDPYQPVEKQLGLTRRVLEVLVRFRNPVAVITKNRLVTRDADLLEELAGRGAAMVYFSITTLDESLRGKLEPRTATAALKLSAMEHLASRGIPTGVMMAPIIPGITEPEIPAVLRAAAAAGAQGAGYTVLRLPYQVAPLFEAWLDAHFPGKKDRVLNRIRSLRGGKLNDPRFGSRMRGEGFYAEEIAAMFRLARRRAGLERRHLHLSTASFRVPEGPQGDLFAEE